MLSLKVAKAYVAALEGAASTFIHPTATCIGHVGDVNTIDYGGGYIVQASPEDRPTLEHFDGLDCEETQDSDEETEIMTVRLYRVDLERDAPSFLADLSWVDWNEIRLYCGQDSEAYTERALLTASNRAQAACDVASYHGWDNLDSYPLELTVAELRARWGGCNAR